MSHRTDDLDNRPLREMYSDYSQPFEPMGRPEQWVEHVSKSHIQKRLDTSDSSETREHRERRIDQWAVLQHEVEEAGMNRPDERTQLQWGQEIRDTDGNTFSPSSHAAPPPPTHAAFSSFNPFTYTQHQVDIVVVGVGGGGMNAINRMMSAKVRGVRFVAMNTDAQVLALSPAQQRVSLGHHQTKGLGVGGNAAMGERAATESVDEIRQALGNADLVFIAAGMGGGTGTGAAPVVASIARSTGALTVGIVTLPFTFEGTRRRRIAQEGIAALNGQIDALITVPNDRLLATAGRDYNLSDAFKIADDVLRQGVQGIAEVINVPGMVNVDFADVRSVLREAGTALMSIGHGHGQHRAQKAADEAIAGGFLNVTIRGAKRVLFNISGGEDMTLFEVNEVAEHIGQAIDDAADITFGAVIDPSLHDSIRVTLIAAGMEEMHTTRLQAIRPETRTSTPSITSSQPQPASTSPAPPVQQPAQPSAPLKTHRTPAHPPEQEQASIEQAHGNEERAGRVRPSHPASPAQPPLPRPVRPQRSLDDLRGLRSMGRRYTSDRDDIDIPPFMKKRE